MKVIAGTVSCHFPDILLHEPAQSQEMHTSPGKNFPLTRCSRNVIIMAARPHRPHNPETENSSTNYGSVS